MPRLFLSIPLMLLIGVACARQTSTAAPATGSSDALRADELRRSGATDLLSAVQRLRPAFLRTRGRTSMVRTEEVEPVVYLDDRPYGSLASLRDIQVSTVVEVRYLSPAQAQMRWGGGEGHSAGAILVITGTPR